jgi:hypothetical protein
MATLSTLLGSGQATVEDPRKEGLPCIATWTMNDDNARQYDCAIYNSEGSTMGNAWSSTGGSQTPGTYTGGNMKDKYWGYSGDNGNPYRTNGELSSNGSSYKIQATTNSSHLPLHAMMNVSPSGAFHSNRYTSGNSVLRLLNYQITQVLPEGIRPRCGITRDEKLLYRSNVLNFAIEKGSPGGEYINLWDDSSLVSLHGQANISPKNVNSNTYRGKGACGYNERTKTFVIIWKESNNQRTFITRYKLTKNLNDTSIPLREIFESASSVTMSGELTMHWAGDQEAHRFSVTVGDNDFIRCTAFRESDKIASWLITASLTNGPGFHSTNGQLYHSNTTSYGIEQGWEHIGQTYNSTWDNKWHMHYSHYYYYGCGISAFVTSTEDPQLCYKFQQSHTSLGLAPHAWGRTGFIITSSNNSDSGDHRFFNLNLAGMKTTLAAFNSGAGKYHSYNEYTQPTNLTTLNINDYANWFPSHGFQSTNYPVYLNVNWWPNASGAMSYSGGVKSDA